MSDNATKVQFDPLVAISALLLDNTYGAAATTYAHPVRQLILQNNTSEPIMVSFDGVNDHIWVKDEVSMILDFTSNAMGSFNQLQQVTGTKVYLRFEQAESFVNNFYISVMYASN